jgi:hypothetical protein
MPATSKQPRQLSDADLQQLLELTKGADSVELKLKVPDSERRSTVTALGMDPLDARSARSTSSTPDLVSNREAIRKLFSKEQRAFFTAHAPEGIGLDDLTMLGPITLLKLKLSPVEYGRRLVAELWMYPDGSRILELSTKYAPAEGFQVAAETRASLAEQGMDLSGEQQTKTKTALEYFSQNLTAAATS